jgi:hypothetical protein
MMQLGYDIGDPVEGTLLTNDSNFYKAPEDNYSTMRSQIDKKSPVKTDTRKADPLKKFLDNDRKVLRFFCYWDDRGSVYGDLRKFVRSEGYLFVITTCIEIACILGR